MRIFNHEVPLEKDELTGQILGNKNQLVVLGFFRQKYKYYVVKCSLCSADSELYLSGLFSAIKSSLMIGQMPCGCAITPKWDKWQHALLAVRAAMEKGLSIVNLPSYEDQRTKITLNCVTHGNFSMSFIKLLNCTYGCIGCVREATSNRKFLRNEAMIEKFKSAGNHPEGTTFSRSDRKNSQNSKCYWYVFCPVCNFTYESTNSDLSSGSRGCLCALNPTKAYINIIYEDGFVRALKFGITSNFPERLYRQNLNAVESLSVTNFGIWQFPCKISTRKAELSCKKEFVCGVIDSQLLADGYTETTYVYNLEQIVNIYESNGGIKIE